MDITVEVMLPPRGAPDYSTSAHSKWRVLSLVGVHIPRLNPPSVNLPNTGYVHVTDVPTRPGWAALTNEEIERRINARLCRMELLGPLHQIVERRRFAGIASLIPAGAANNLRTNRQITVTWTQFKAVIQDIIDARQLADDDLGD